MALANDINMVLPYAGKWHLHSSDNYDAYLEQLGVSRFHRGLAACISPKLTIEIVENRLRMTSSSWFISKTLECELGVEFEEDTPDGRRVRSVVKATDDNKLVSCHYVTRKQGQAGDHEKEIFTHVERSIEDGKLILVYECNNVIAKRIYAKAA